MPAAYIPVSGFPLSSSLSATCHPELPPATRIYVTQLGQHAVLPLPRDSGYTLAIMPRPR